MAKTRQVVQCRTAKVKGADLMGRYGAKRYAHSGSGLRLISPMRMGRPTEMPPMGVAMPKVMDFALKPTLASFTAFRSSPLQDFDFDQIFQP